MLAISAGGWAAIIAAVFWALLVVFLALVMVNLFRLLQSTKEMVDSLRGQMVPLLGEMRVTVTSVNRELDQVDGVVQSAGTMAKSAQRLTTAAEHALASPLIKFAAIGAGLSRMLRRLGDRLSRNRG